MKFPVPDPVNSSKILHDMKKDTVNKNPVVKMPTDVTDTKMNTFLDEMRQQFLQTQNVNVIP
jgi:hypothetical protein